MLCREPCITKLQSTTYFPISSNAASNYLSKLPDQTNNRLNGEQYCCILSITKIIWRTQYTNIMVPKPKHIPNITRTNNLIGSDIRYY